MKKTDGLVELLAVEVGKFSIPSNKEITKLANSVRTYISERLPKERGFNCIDSMHFGEGWDSCLKSVREALGVDNG